MIESRRQRLEMHQDATGYIGIRSGYTWIDPPTFDRNPTPTACNDLAAAAGVSCQGAESATGAGEERCRTGCGPDAGRCSAGGAAATLAGAGRCSASHMPGAGRCSGSQMLALDGTRRCSAEQKLGGSPLFNLLSIDMTPKRDGY